MGIDRKLLIFPGQVVFVAGKKGSGKSVLARTYLSRAWYPNVVLLDSKGDEPWPEAGATWESGKTPIYSRLKDLANYAGGRVVYRPNRYELNGDNYDAFYEWAYDWAGKNVRTWRTPWGDFKYSLIILTDELFAVVQAGKTDGFTACLTRGRSRGLGMWNLCQRPMFIPLFAISESDHRFMFRLNMPQDRKRMAEACGLPELLDNPPGEHGFWYHRDGESQAVACPEGLPLSK